MTVESPVQGARAQKLGLQSAEDVEREWEEAHAGWTAHGVSQAWWFCPFCDCDFWSPSGARKHMKWKKHRVLRGDWYSELEGMGPK